MGWKISKLDLAAQGLAALTPILFFGWMRQHHVVRGLTFGAVT
jgi:ABC-type glycerol-3-phosphate transport system permease component